MKGEFFTGLDIGSTNIYVAVGRINKNSELEIIGASSVPCQGLRNGMVVNIDETTRAVTEAIKEAESSADVPIKAVSVGIEGPHIESFTHEGAVMISRTDKVICQEDIIRAMDAARAIRMPPDREIMQTMPQGFTVDGQSGVEDPLGMEGGHLVVSIHIVTGVSTAISNIMKCINNTGVEITDIVLGILAASNAVITKDERDLGCILMDFGGQTVNLALFSGGHIQMTRELAIGGDIVTRDIAHCMRILPSEAKRVKEMYGGVMVKTGGEHVEITALGMDNKTRLPVSERELCDIIESRIKEILKFVHEEIRKCGQEDMLPAGAVLIGGTASLKGIKELAEEIMGMPVRLGIPHNLTGITNVVASPSFATAVGLVKTAETQVVDGRKTIKGKRSSLFAAIRRWIEDVF